MGFQQGLSGLNAASRGLDVIGNNIANANTVGMKASRAEFAELYASNLGAGGGGGNEPGIGVSTSAISQQFSQGNLSTTGNDLDLAINGSGFYTVQLASGEMAYSRAGNFKLDKEGNIVTNAGAKLQGNIFDPVTGAVTKGSLGLPTGKGIAGVQSGTITATANLDTESAIASTVIPPTPVTTYGTSLTVYDSQGAAIPVGLYYKKTAANEWDVYADYTKAGGASTMQDTSTPPKGTPIGTVKFGADGTLSAIYGPRVEGAALGTMITTAGPPKILGTLKVPDVQITGGATPKFDIALNVDNMTQNASSFYVSSLKQDGYAPGELTGMKIEENGIITARYSNGQTQSAGQLLLANFRNNQGLEPSSGGYWKETASSGAPLKNTPGSGNFGKLVSGTLEDSNVDLTGELVNMMTAQRAYQANAQTIKTQDQIMSTLVNLR